MPWYWHLVLGGFAFGMVFMATDPVSACNTDAGPLDFRYSDRRSDGADPGGQSGLPGRHHAGDSVCQYLCAANRLLRDSRQRQAPEATPCRIDRKQRSGILSWPRDSKRNTVLVAVLLSLVCSVLVSAAAVVLRPLQERNAERNRQKIILEVAGLLRRRRRQSSQQFSQVEAHVVDLASGAYARTPGSRGFTMRHGPPATRHCLPASRRRKILPASAAGPTSRPSISCARTANCATSSCRSTATACGRPCTASSHWSATAIRLPACSFYEHAETPGLGAEIDNPQWRAQWQGKLVYGENEAAPASKLSAGHRTAHEASPSVARVTRSTAWPVRR